MSVASRVIRASELAGLIEDDRPVTVEFGQYWREITLIREGVCGLHFNERSA